MALSGLQWGDVDLDKATLRVERSVEETKAGLRLKSPKTKRGRRNVSLSSDAVALLRDHRRVLARAAGLSSGRAVNRALVFSTLEGELLSPDNLSRDWCRVGRIKKSCRVSLSMLFATPTPPC